MKEIKNTDIEKFESGESLPTFSQYEKIASALTINIRDLIPNDKIEDKVVIKNKNDEPKWVYPEDTKSYEFRELASSTSLPFSKAFEISILKNNNEELDLKSGLHQYVYNIGTSSITINWIIQGKKHNEEIQPGDSLYIIPFISHNFSGLGKLLVLRIGGKVAGESQRELSIVGKKNAERAISETMQWFDTKGKK